MKFRTFLIVGVLGTVVMQIVSSAPSSLIHEAKAQDCSSGLLPSPTNVRAIFSNGQFTIQWDPIACSGALYQVDQVLDIWNCVASCSTTVAGPTSDTRVVVDQSRLLGGIGRRPNFRFTVIAIIGLRRSDWQQSQSNQIFAQQGSTYADVTQGDNCGCTGPPKHWWQYLPGGRVIDFIQNPNETVRKAICESVCELSKAAGALAGWLVRKLIETSGVSIDPSFADKLANTCWLKLLA